MNFTFKGNRRRQVSVYDFRHTNFSYKRNPPPTSMYQFRLMNFTSESNPRPPMLVCHTLWCMHFISNNTLPCECVKLITFGIRFSLSCASRRHSYSRVWPLLRSRPGTLQSARMVPVKWNNTQHWNYVATCFVNVH